jgi:hypothetical protein
VNWIQNRRALLLLVQAAFLLCSVAGFTRASDAIDTSICQPIPAKSKVAYIDTGTKVLDIKPFRANGFFQEGFALVEDGATGGSNFVDKRGKVLYPTPFGHAESFAGGMAKVSLHLRNGKTGYSYIKKNGKLLPISVTGGHAFHERYAVVSNADGYGIINEDGHFLIEHRDELNDIVSEGLVGFRSGSLWGFIDLHNRSVVIQPKYSTVRPFCEGFAAVQRADGKWLFVDNRGHEIARAFDNVQDFHSGVAAFALKTARGTKWGLVSRTGKVISPAQYDSVTMPKKGIFSTQNGEIFRTECGDVFGFVDLRGRPISPSSYVEASDFREGMAAVAVKRNGRLAWGFIDKLGEMVIPTIFSSVNLGFINGYAAVAMRTDREPRWGFIDKKGQWIVTPQFKSAYPFSNGYALVEYFQR